MKKEQKEERDAEMYTVVREELDLVFPVLHSSKIECLRGPCAPCTYLLTHARTHAPTHSH